MWSVPFHRHSFFERGEGQGREGWEYLLCPIILLAWSARREGVREGFLLGVNEGILSYMNLALHSRQRS